MIEVSADGISFEFEPDPGILNALTVIDGGVVHSPLHRAPWVGRNEAFPSDMPPHLGSLGGDFFCAPFCGTEDGSPFHGWPANFAWEVVTRESDRLGAVLKRTVQGAILIKELSVEDGHPFIYQRHTFVGGSGTIPVSNHACVSVADGALIRCSAKSAWYSPASPLETDPELGRSALYYPATSPDPRVFPGAAGSKVDLTAFPWISGHEDAAVGLEAPGHEIGWTAISRPIQGDVFLSIRNARSLPMTTLWHSDRGRFYPPWSGRHGGCLGVEEGVALAFLGDDRTGLMDGPEALDLHSAGVAEVRHAIGVIAWPGDDPIVDVALEGRELRISGESGLVRQVPFRDSIVSG